MTEIYVDADACPVKQEIVRAAERRGLVVHMVSNGWAGFSGSQNVRRVLVEQGPDAADDWIAGRAGAGDLVVTRDIPLAARCLEQGARVIGPEGRPFTAANIGAALAMRDLAAHRRETGEASGGPPPFARKDRLRFLDAIERELQALRRQQEG